MNLMSLWIFIENIKIMSKIEDCTKNISLKNFFIKDDESSKISIIVQENGQFKVINKTSENINFLAIDGCMYSSSDASRCDCAVFDDNVFCFIELKTCKIKSRNVNRAKADKQLKETIIKFKNENLIGDRKMEAYTCITCKKDELFTTITNVSNKSKQVEFLDELDTELYYECKKEFQ